MNFMFLSFSVFIDYNYLHKHQMCPWSFCQRQAGEFIAHNDCDGYLLFVGWLQQSNTYKDFAICHRIKQANRKKNMPHKVRLPVNNPCESHLFTTTITLCTKSSTLKLSYWKVHPQGISETAYCYYFYTYPKTDFSMNLILCP